VSGHSVRSSASLHSHHGVRPVYGAKGAQAKGLKAAATARKNAAKQAQVAAKTKAKAAAQAMKTVHKKIAIVKPPKPVKAKKTTTKAKVVRS
jgi:hypothetical protein